VLCSLLQKAMTSVGSKYMLGSDRRSTGEKKIADSHQTESIHKKIDLNRLSLIVTPLPVRG